MENEASEARPDYFYRYGEDLHPDSRMLLEQLGADEVQELFEALHEITVIPMSIIDRQGNVLFSSPWQDVCGKYYRVQKETCARCVDSDTRLTQEQIDLALSEGRSYCVYLCRNGLLHSVSPIVVEGRHVANLFTGQFLTEPPDEAFFRQQAAEFGFPEEEFLAAVRRAPVVPRARLDLALEALSRLARTITRLCIDRGRADRTAASLRVQIAERERVEQELLNHRRHLEDLVAAKTGELLQAVRQLEYQATHDQLTGILNRRHCEAILRNEIGRARRYDIDLSLAMFDIDFFKNFNDALGHEAGDEVLQRIANVVQGELRMNDSLARWGGEEFVVVLPETGLGPARQLAERIRAAVAGMPPMGDLPLAVSVGVVQWRDESADALMHRVDAALYAAKRKGRNRVEG